MPQVLLKRLIIRNFGPISNDTVELEPFTYFIGRNNSGKSHYLLALEILLSKRRPTAPEIEKLQNDKEQEIYIQAEFEGVENFTHHLASSNHKNAVEAAIVDGKFNVVRTMHSSNDELNDVGVLKDGGIIHPAGTWNNITTILPETIQILATADTIDELKNSQNTALGKLKVEVLTAFFSELKEKTKNSLTELDSFLHGDNEEERSSELKVFEEHLYNEIVGEFEDVIPSIEFKLPDEEMIAKEMKIYLDDGCKTEIE